VTTPGGNNPTPSPDRRPQGGATRPVAAGGRFTSAIGGWFAPRGPGISLPEAVCPECRSAIRGLGASVTRREIEEMIDRCGCLARAARAPAKPSRGSKNLRVQVVSTRPATALRVTPVVPAQGPEPVGPISADLAQAAEEGVDPRTSSIPQVRYRLASGLLVRAIFPAETCQALREHCETSNDHGREVGGLLVGFRHPEGAGEVSMIATDVLPMESADSSTAHVRLDAEAWFRVGEEFEGRYRPQGKERLGWYHTHPSQGIFFSKQDLNAHTVFTLPHQFALVVDPRRMEAGLFHWEDIAARRLSDGYLFAIQPGWKHDRGRMIRDPETVDQAEPGSTAVVLNEDREPSTARPPRSSRISGYWIYLIVVVVLAWLVALLVLVLIS
jgi:proteasome lid subunit RPN8/RPN11